MNAVRLEVGGRERMRPVRADRPPLDAETFGVLPVGLDAARPLGRMVVVAGRVVGDVQPAASEDPRPLDRVATGDARWCRPVPERVRLDLLVEWRPRVHVITEVVE